MAVIIRRLEFFLVTLWAALTINFFLPRLMPGNPAEIMMAKLAAHGHVNPKALNALEVAFGVKTSKSLLQQYVEYLGNSLQGNFGISTSQYPATVNQIIFQALPWTVGLATVTLIISFVLGTLIGMIAAWRRGGLIDSIVPSVFIVVSAIPFFLVGLFFIYFFSLSHAWFPMGFGYDQGSTITLSWSFVGQIVSHAALPASAIIITSIGGWILTMRNNMITTLSEDYIRMARAKGLPSWRIMLMYAGRNAILPNLTGLALSLGFVISGLILVEIVFTYPGVGYLFFQAVAGEDYPLMQALFLITTVAVLLAVLLADALNALLDPRIRGRG